MFLRISRDEWINMGEGPVQRIVFGTTASRRPSSVTIHFTGSPSITRDADAAIAMSDYLIHCGFDPMSHQFDKPPGGSTA